jgi:hypothetical protein
VERSLLAYCGFAIISATVEMHAGHIEPVL